MRHRVLWSAVLVAAVLVPSPAHAQQTAGSTVKTTVDEVLLDLIVRDKKGKPVTDLKQEDVSVLDNGVKQTLTSFRLVSGSEAVSTSGAKTALDPLRQIRLVTLAFDSMPEIDQRKLARTAAIDLIKGDQGSNVYFAVVVINTQLYVLQQFTRDKAALTKTIERATGGTGPGFASESDAIQTELRRNLAGQNGADQPGNLLAAASQTGSQAVNNGSEALQATLAQVMLSMLRLDAAVAAQGRAPDDRRAAGAGGWPKIDSRPEVGDILHHGDAPSAGAGRAFPQSDGHGEPQQHHVLLGGYARGDDDFAERGSRQARWPAPPVPARPP